MITDALFKYNVTIPVTPHTTTVSSPFFPSLYRLRDREEGRRKRNEEREAARLNPITHALREELLLCWQTRREERTVTGVGHEFTMIIGTITLTFRPCLRISSNGLKSMSPTNNNT